MNKKLKNYFGVIVGLVIMALSFNLFQKPFCFSTGGISGFSQIVTYYTHINESIIIFIGNIFLIVLSFVFLGKEKTRNTIVGALLFPILISLLEPVANFLDLSHLDPVLIAIFGGMATGFGAGLIYKNGFTSGGTDILNQIIELKYKIPMGKSILFVDGSIVLASAFCFGFPNMLYSIVMITLISLVSNKTMLELNHNKVLYIYTEKPKLVEEYLMKTFAYDMTIFNVKGGFSLKKQKLIMTSVSKRDYYAVKEGIMYLDPRSFIIITNAYEQLNANVLLREN